MSNDIPFTENDVKAYLDKCIRKWRKRRDTRGADHEVAPYYIDAFQSVRTSLFGEILGSDDDPKS